LAQAASSFSFPDTFSSPLLNNPTARNDVIRYSYTTQVRPPAPFVFLIIDWHILHLVGGSAMKLYLFASSALSLLFSCVYVAESAQGKDAKAERDALQGKWLVNQESVSGKPLSDEEVKARKKTVTFSGSKVTVSRFRPEGNLDVQTGSFEIDVTKRPKRINLKVKLTAEFLELRGIYEIDGDSMKLIWTGGKADRPETFATTKGDKYLLMVLEKQKKPGA
jgi:uncharacterized protein (TIGR03067 family)